MSSIKVVSYMTLDGMAATEGSETGMDWYPYDESLDQVYIEAYEGAEAILFGRKSFEALRGYWPTEASRDEPAELRAVNTMPKVVFSRSLDNPQWEPTRIERELTPAAIEKLKADFPKGLLAIGSGALVTQLLQMGQIDELCLIVIPTVLGRGKPFFAQTEDFLPLELVDAKPYGNGNLVVRYRSKRATA